MAINNGETIGLVYHPDYLIHTQDQHPERKERLEHILKALEEEKLKERVVFMEPEPAAVEDIALIHDPAYIRAVEEACREGRRFLDMDTYITPRSFEIALLAAGGALTGLRAVMEGRHKKVFSLARPPGHHAERSKAMGFCLFNNIAVAAAAARRDYGLQRVAVIDWDVHHGNGTQNSFYDDPSVLYISLHQSPAYPGTGDMWETGRGEGQGYTVNIPLPAGCGDAEYAMFFERVIVPVLEEYRPELVMVSAGQDAYYRDPLAGMALTLQGFFKMARDLAGVAERFCAGRMLFCLEGGYHLQGQAAAVVQVLNAAGRWGLPVPEKSPALAPSQAALRRLEEVLAALKVPGTF